MVNKKPDTSQDDLYLRRYQLSPPAANQPGGYADLADNRHAIWYELTALAQDVANWAPKHSPRDARVIADLLNDLWAVWDRELQSFLASPKLISELLRRIHDRSSSDKVRERVLRIDALLDGRTPGPPLSF